MPQAEEALTYAFVEVSVARVPAIRAGLAPKGEDIADARVREGPRHDTALLPCSGGSSLGLLAQLAAQDFADIGLRQACPELDLLRHLVGSELGAAELDHVFSGEVLVLPDDEGLDRFAGLGVLHADHGTFQDARVACDHFLDLVRIDVEAGDEDHVLLAIDDLGVAVRAHHADVTGAEIAVGRHHLGGLVRPVPVTGHYLRAPGADFAGLAERHFVAVIVADRDPGRG